MLRSEERAALERDRAAVREFLSGGGQAPLTIRARAAYSIRDVVCPSWRDEVLLAVRYVLVSLAGHVPFCRVKNWVYRRAGVKIGRDVCVSPGVTMDPLYPFLIELEDGCVLGMGCRLLAHEYTGKAFRIGRIRVGRGAVIGAYSLVRCGVSVGRMATVAAMSFANRDVADGQTVGGVPARPLGEKGEAAK